MKLYQFTQKDGESLYDAWERFKEMLRLFPHHGMNKISSLDHLSVKVDALFQKFDKINVSAVSPTSISPPCGACENLGHTSIECKLGSAAESIEQLNFIQNNQGIRSNQKFY